MKENTIYITTPIYYANGVPHIGHSYTSFIADIYVNFYKNLGASVKFTTGVDENSQKIVQKANELGRDTMEYLDEMAEKHKTVWDELGIAKYADIYDFIRTTEPRHKKIVQEMLQKSFDNGDIYKGKYQGKYCVGCEAFKKDDDLIERGGKLVCPDHLTEPDFLTEENYFFRLSKYQTWLEEFYKNNPDFIAPAFRQNEVLAFIKGGLEDFSVSREGATFGIPIPFDKSHMTYVRFDALFNYYTSCKKNAEKKDDSAFWPANLHIVGKDIIRFHAIYWPAMLASVFGLGKKDTQGLLHYTPEDKKLLPQNIVVNGYFTIDGQKISKSLGNVIAPGNFIEEYSRDLLLLYLFSSFRVGSDGDFDNEQAVKYYNAKLANNLGNLLNRILVLGLKTGGVLDLDKKVLQAFENLDIQLQEKLSLFSKNFLKNFHKKMKLFQIKESLDEAFEFLDLLNIFVDRTQPRSIIKTDKDLAKNILAYTASELVKIASALWIFFPEKMQELVSRLGVDTTISEIFRGVSIEKFYIVEKGSPLFERFE